MSSIATRHTIRGSTPSSGSKRRACAPKLTSDYSRTGLDDPVVIRLRRGSYIPAFEERPVAPPADSRVPDRAVAAAPTKPRWILTMGLIAAGLVIVAAVGWRAASRSATSQAPLVRVAVLPLAHYSNQQADEMLAARLTDGVTTELARFGTLAVVSHTSASQFAGAQPSAPRNRACPERSAGRRRKCRHEGRSRSGVSAARGRRHRSKNLGQGLRCFNLRFGGTSARDSHSRRRRSRQPSPVGNVTALASAALHVEH